MQLCFGLQLLVFKNWKNVLNVLCFYTYVLPSICLKHCLLRVLFEIKLKYF